MRLFIALNLPPLDLFTTLQKEIDDPDLRMVKTFHLTLKFLGEVNESIVKNIVEQLTHLTLQPLTLTFDHIGFFPNSSRPQVVWVGINEQEEVMLLQKKIDASLSTLFPLDKHFHPHVTLARVKRISTPNTWLKKTYELKIPTTVTQTSSFSLIQSNLTPQGPVYTVLREFSKEKSA